MVLAERQANRLRMLEERAQRLSDNATTEDEQRSGDLALNLLMNLDMLVGRDNYARDLSRKLRAVEDILNCAEGSGDYYA